jgi:hypothetical protein
MGLIGCGGGVTDGTIGNGATGTCRGETGVGDGVTVTDVDRYATGVGDGVIGS